MAPGFVARAIRQLPQALHQALEPLFQSYDHPLKGARVILGYPVLTCS